MTQTTDLQARLTYLTTEAGRAALARATRDSIGGTRMVMLRLWMHGRDARCVSCGIVTRTDVPKSDPRAAELGHLISASTAGASSTRAGFVPGNIGIMCHTCNSDAGIRDLSFTAEMLIHPELVPLEWPTLRPAKAKVSQDAEWSRNNRKW